MEAIICFGPERRNVDLLLVYSSQKFEVHVGVNGTTDAATAAHVHLGKDEWAVLEKDDEVNDMHRGAEKTKNLEIDF